MYSLVRIARYKLPVLIAIFAMLLLFVAPEVSKTLENRDEEHAIPASSEKTHHMHHMTESSGQDVGMSTENTPTHHEIVQHDHSAQTSIADMPGMMHGDKMDGVACGYCVMLIHCPLMIWVFFAIIWLTLRISVTPPPLRILRHFTPFYPGIAQPRAPPAY